MGLGQTCYPKKIGCLGQTMIDFFQMSSLLTRYPIRQTYPNLSWLPLRNLGWIAACDPEEWSTRQTSTCPTRICRGSADGGEPTGWAFFKPGLVFFFLAENNHNQKHVFFFTTKNSPWYLIKQVLFAKCNGVKVVYPPAVAMDCIPDQHGGFSWRKSLEFDCRRGYLHSTHRIHGAAIYYSNMDPINMPHYTPVMLAYIPAPWIRHGHRYWLKKETQELLVSMMYQSFSVKKRTPTADAIWGTGSQHLAAPWGTLLLRGPGMSELMMVEIGCGWIEVARNSTDMDLWWFVFFTNELLKRPGK